MKYSLQSLMIVVTLGSIVFGGRVEYLRRWADYHEREWRRLCLDPSGDLLHRDANVHLQIKWAYEKAMWRTWIIVDEAECEDKYWQHLEDPLGDMPNSQAPATKPPKA